MTAESVLVEAFRAGVQIELAGDGYVTLRSPRPIPWQIRELVREHKAALLEFLDERAWVYCRAGACKVAALHKDHVLVVLRCRPDRFEWIRRDELTLTPPEALEARTRP